MQQNIQHRTGIDINTLHKIKTAKFLPILRKPSAFPLKWIGDQYVEGSLISCNESYLGVQQYQVCCSYPIIDENKSFNHSFLDLKQLLGLTDKLVRIDVLVFQTLEILTIAEENKDS